MPTREEEIVERLAKVHRDALVVTPSGDFPIRIPGKPKWTSVANVWQGTHPERARGYAEVFANAAPDLHYLLGTLATTRTAVEVANTKVTELETEVSRLRDLLTTLEQTLSATQTELSEYRDAR